MNVGTCINPPYHPPWGGPRPGPGPVYSNLRVVILNDFGYNFGMLKWEEIPGNEHVKRALEVAAVGYHPVLFVPFDIELAEDFEKYASSLGVKVTKIEPAEFEAAIRLRFSIPIQVAILQPEPFEIVRMVGYGAKGESFDELKKRIEGAQDFRRRVSEVFSGKEDIILEDIKIYGIGLGLFLQMFQVARSCAALEKNEKVDAWHWKEALALWRSAELALVAKKI